MEKNKYITDEEWSAIARNLYEGEGTDRPPGRGLADDADGIEKTAAKIDLYFRLKEFDAGAAYKEMKCRETRMPVNAIAWTGNRFLKIAAVVVLVLLVASAGFYMGGSRAGAGRHAGVAVDRYGNSRINLPDGSVVTLNHDTKISYPDQFTGPTRDVQIEGEAYFEVAPDAGHPFLIRAGEAEIKVLGTTFSVNAYPASERVEVVVETGKVQIRKVEMNRTGINEVTLDPGDRGILSGAGGGLVKSRNDNPNFLSWKTREFVFDRVPLKEVMQQLNKVYQVTVKANEPAVENLLLTARFEGRSLDFILKVIEMTHDLRTEQKNDYYLITKK